MPHKKPDEITCCKCRKKEPWPTKPCADGSVQMPPGFWVLISAGSCIAHFAMVDEYENLTVDSEVFLGEVGWAMCGECLAKAVGVTDKCSCGGPILKSGRIDIYANCQADRKLKVCLTKECEQAWRAEREISTP